MKPMVELCISSGGITVRDATTLNELFFVRWSGWPERDARTLEILRSLENASASERDDIERAEKEVKVTPKLPKTFSVNPGRPGSSYAEGT